MNSRRTPSVPLAASQRRKPSSISAVVARLMLSDANPDSRGGLRG